MGQALGFLEIVFSLRFLSEVTVAATGDRRLEALEAAGLVMEPV
jgi:hypothetical protein